MTPCAQATSVRDIPISAPAGTFAERQFGRAFAVEAGLLGLVELELGHPRCLVLLPLARARLDLFCFLCSGWRGDWLVHWNWKFKLYKRVAFVRSFARVQLGV